MKDKICIVTGGNSGIGKVTARALAQKGAKVIVVARNKAKGEEAVKDIINESKNESVDLILCDFSSQKSIHSFADEFKKKYDRLDVLVNNAGLIVDKRTITEEGIETTFATNHLGYFLTTYLLFDILKESKPARIVNVASEAHRVGNIDFSDINYEKSFNPIKAYGQSKFNNILFTYELAERIEKNGITGITANCLHPGTIASNFGQSGQKWFAWGAKLLAPFFYTVEQGAVTQIYLATSPEVEGINGKYFNKKRAVKSSKASYDKEGRQKLWEISENLTKVKFL